MLQGWKSNPNIQQFVFQTTRLEETLRRAIAPLFPAIQVMKSNPRISNRAGRDSIPELLSRGRQH